MSHKDWENIRESRNEYRPAIESRAVSPPYSGDLRYAQSQGTNNFRDYDYSMQRDNRGIYPSAYSELYQQNPGMPEERMHNSIREPSQVGRDTFYRNARGIQDHNTSVYPNSFRATQYEKRYVSSVTERSQGNNLNNSRGRYEESEHHADYYSSFRPSHVPAERYSHPYEAYRNYPIQTNRGNHGMSSIYAGSNHPSALSAGHYHPSPGYDPYNSHPRRGIHQPMQAHSYASRNMPYAPSSGSGAPGRSINKMLLEMLRDRAIDPMQLQVVIDSFINHMDCVNLATLLFHCGKKRFVLSSQQIKLISDRMSFLRDELRSREASNALYGLRCLSADVPEVRELIYAIATKMTMSESEFAAQGIGNALYGCQMLSSEYEEVRLLAQVLGTKVSNCMEPLEAQNVGNALYGIRGMSSEYKEVRMLIAALVPKIARSREDLNGQALGNSLYGLQNMNSKEVEVRALLNVLATKVSRTWEDLKAQEIGNALYGLKKMSSDVAEVRSLLRALVIKIASSPDVLDAQATGNAFYALQNMNSESPEVLSLLSVLADKVNRSMAELDGQAMGNSIYGLQGMHSEHVEVRQALSALSAKIQSSPYEMNAQELGNAMYGLQNMNSSYYEVRQLLYVIMYKMSSSRQELTSQEIGNSIYGLLGMSSEFPEVRAMVSLLGNKIAMSRASLDPQGVANSAYGLQRLCCDCREVRDLVVALAYKYEQSWKVIGAHHVSHACFGLQALSSEYAEVRILLKALVTKILSCREEMSARQLCLALFGLQNLSSDEVEVRSLLLTITEKVALSTDVWTPQQLALAFFGLQGMSSEEEETKAMLSALLQKARFSMLQGIDAVSFGNMVFGLQRMSANSADVCELLQVLANVFPYIALSAERSCFAIAANILYGLLSSSVDNPITQRLLEAVINCLHECLVILHHQSSDDQPREALKEGANLLQANLLLAFTFSKRGMHSFPELRKKWQGIIDDLERIVLKLAESHYSARSLTAAERNVKQSLQTHLFDPISSAVTGRITVKGPVMLHGFELGVVLEREASSGNSNSAAASSTTAAVFVEVIGTSYSSSMKKRFCALRAEYLESSKGVRVIRIAAKSIDQHLPGLLDSLRGIFGLHSMTVSLPVDRREWIEYIDDDLWLNEGEFSDRASGGRAYSNYAVETRLGWIPESASQASPQHVVPLKSNAGLALMLSERSNYNSLGNGFSNTPRLGTESTELPPPHSSSTDMIDRFYFNSSIPHDTSVHSSESSGGRLQYAMSLLSKNSPGVDLDLSSGEFSPFSDSPNITRTSSLSFSQSKQPLPSIDLYVSEGTGTHSTRLALGVAEQSELNSARFEQKESKEKESQATLEVAKIEEQLKELQIKSKMDS